MPQKGLTAKKREARLAGTYHYHGCVICHRIYEDRCKQTDTDAACPDCCGGHRAVWVVDRDPHACCVNTALLLDQEALARYRCVGLSTWWICLVCARVRPSRTTADPEPDLTR